MNKCIAKIAASLILLSFLAAPVLGVSMSYSAGNGAESVSSSAKYNLDKSTSLTERTVIADVGLYQTREAAGSGRNSLQNDLAGNGASINSEIQSSGSLRTSSSAVAGNGGAGLDQDVALSGDSGYVGMVSSSDKNTMIVAGGFGGDDGSLTTDLSAVAADRAAIGGSASMAGVEVLNDDHMNIVASGDIAMSVNALYQGSEGGLGEFDVMAVNREMSSDDVGSSVDALTGPAYTSDGGRNAAYLLGGWRWNTRDPQIQFKLKNDGYLTAEGLNTAAVQSSLTAATTTWDDATNQNLFSDAGVGTTTAAADAYDRTNTIAWKGFPSSLSRALAYSRSWYNYNKVGGYYSAIESDISFNSGYSWSTSGAYGKYDVETVGLHEMGHSIGLLDLYGKAAYTSDKRQVMHYYTGVKRTLGNGDKTGVWALYG